ncbi:glycosyltransferase family 2 protein [Tabrizicola sp. J26]|uniref:glycosyltransferase family 2 protein n=1 Tax=Alitabrizicola rongguiensis TaxID=2909234 RepID=UPI001F2E5156|nr:glycosyltransferase family 2 protein [Tabrizicola rongguiensis]MCF1708452.1 glycosyltransferase family 2 protein [Tabrizicola rongguiensis]
MDDPAPPQPVARLIEIGANGLPLPRTGPHGMVTAVSMMKDEGPFVLEWVAHHLVVGFTRLIVYTNDCSDGTDRMLMRLEELGLAHHRANVIPEGQRPQPSALNHAQDEPLVGESDWVMVFDADEFLQVRFGDGTLDSLIAAIEARGANGIIVTWRIFGSGGVQDWSRAPVTEQYLYAAPPMWNKGWGVKTLFRFDPDHWKLGIHRPKIKSKWLKTDFPDQVHWLNGSGLPMEDYFKFRGWRSIVRTVGYDWVQMNHYAVKSIDSYAIRKFRGNVNFKKDKYNADYWALQDRNEVRDDTMLRYATERKRVFDALLTDPVLNQLHFAALERAEARLAEFKGTPAYEELVGRLKDASRIPISDVEAKPPQARDPEKIAALMSEVEKTRAAGRKAEKAATPPERRPGVTGLYVRNPPAMTEDVPMTWVSNQGIDLPADPRLFTPGGLVPLQAGKFERHLCRSLCKTLPRGSRLLEIGCGPGYVAAVLNHQRPDIRQTLLERNPNLREALRRIWQRNGVVEGEGLRLLPDWDSLPALLADLKPRSIILGDPEITGPELADAIAASGQTPDLVLLSNRNLAVHRLDFEACPPAFAAIGLTEHNPLDIALTVAFQRPGTARKT